MGRRDVLVSMACSFRMMAQGRGEQLLLARYGKRQEFREVRIMVKVSQRTISFLRVK